MPLRPRPRPSTIPVLTYEGKRNRLPHDPATIKIMNIYDSSLPWPEGVVRDKRIKWLRVLQVFPKNNDDAGKYYGTGYGGSGSLGYAANVDYGDVNGCRFPLGVVPVEDDGSAYFYAPVRRDIYFQALDENSMAIQSMRSATYVQSGEQLTCVGCHEDKWTSLRIASSPKALSRPPSVIRTEAADGAVPFSFHRLVKPVLTKSCIPCHQKQQSDKAPTDMEYGSLRKYAFCFTAPRSLGGVAAGGSHTIPGHFGALASRMGQALLNPTHQKAIQAGHISQDDFRRVVLWLDCNSAQFGSVYSLKDVYAQLRGEVVFPKIDYEPWNPLGLEIYAGDDSPPSTATGLRITPAAEEPCAIDLTWEPAADGESGVGCYAVYRDDQLLGWSVAPSYRDGNVVPGDQFTYHVLAVNRSGVEGPPSKRAIGACRSRSGVPHIVRWDDSNPRMTVSASGEQRTDLHDPLNLVNGSGLSGSKSKTVFDASLFAGPHRQGRYLRRVSRGLNRSSLSGESEGHDTNEGHMWQSAEKQIARAWVQFDLARPYRLRKLRIWNFNARPDDGVQRADILISTDGTNWTLHAEDVVFPRADGSNTYLGFEYDLEKAITAIGVRIQVKSNHGGDAVGLAEVQFLHTVPEAR
ncbi:MAG: discoidin domain-containing protein [Lentisphaerae bacterium]|nr:discoidin domain-containing protein [Lentisphaerota bacterium]